MTPEGCISQSGPPPLLGHTGAVRSGAVEVVTAKAGAGARCGRLCRLVPHGATQVPDPASSRMESIPLLFPRSCQDFVVDLTLEHLAGQGASTVALVSDDTASSTGRSRFDAFWLTVSRVPGPEMGVALLGSFSIDFGTKAARELLRHSRLPDAVVCGSDLVALGVVREFRQSGIALAATRTEMIMMLATPMAPTSRATASKALPRQPRPGIVGYRARYGGIRNPV
jgi:hypothetical protein